MKLSEGLDSMDAYKDEILLAFLIIVFLATWLYTRDQRVFELIFGSLTALLGILKGKIFPGKESK